MKKELKISKLDAAKRQLEVAINLYFTYGDPVAIHTLVSAAHEVLDNLKKKRGGETWKEWMLDAIKHEYRKEFSTKINEARNFFKHADRDADSSLDFNPDQSEILILDACRTYWDLSGERPPLLRLFHMWYGLLNPQIFENPEPDIEGMSILRQAASQGTFSRELFYQTMLPFLMRLSVNSGLEKALMNQQMSERANRE